MSTPIEQNNAGLQAILETINELPDPVTDAVLYTEQTLTEEQKTQARENIGVGATPDNPDCHAVYFTITDEGVVALKPEYRGASTKTSYPFSISDMGSGINGSKNAELPKYIIVPEIVDGKAVCGLAEAIFCANLIIESVVLPTTITEISERCFDGCNNLKNVYNTENIEIIGKCAFQSTSILRLRCPNLKEIEDICTFQNCGGLIYIDVGSVETLPDKTFNACVNLNMIKSANKITSVGTKCLQLTANLKHADFISNLTNIGEGAFLCSDVDYDWSTLSNCTFGTDATPLQYNPTDFWSACTFTPCENRLPTFLSQSDTRWTDREIGTTGKTYSDGCLLFCCMHAYCGLHNIELSSVIEFEEIVNDINPNLLNTFSTSINEFKTFCEGLGLSVERYSTYNQTVLQTLYDSLADGKYALIALVGSSISSGHAVMAYGIDNNGDLLLADSVARCKDNTSEPVTHSLPYHKLSAPTYYGYYILNIISL